MKLQNTETPDTKKRKEEKKEGKEKKRIRGGREVKRQNFIKYQKEKR